MWRLWDLIQSNTQENIQPNPPSSGFTGECALCARTSRWVRETGAPRADASVLLSLNSLLPIIGGRAVVRRPVVAHARSHKPWQDDEFFISAAHSDIISMRRSSALTIAAAGWWRAVCRPQPVPQTLHHVRAGFMSPLLINFHLSFSPYTALEQSSRQWQEQLLTAGLAHFFFLSSSSSFSYLMCAAGIFTAVTGCANISSPPRRL